jgi:hypothetical protein
VRYPSLMDAAAPGGFSAETIAGDLCILRLAISICMMNSTNRTDAFAWREGIVTLVVCFVKSRRKRAGGGWFRIMPGSARVEYELQLA